MTQKRPREYAAEIIAMPRVADRRKALARVPEGIRDLVAAHVRSHIARMKAARQRG